MNGRRCSKPVMTILNMLWCHLALLTHLMFSSIWWIMFFMNIWTNSCCVTLMTLSFSQETWRTMNTMYISFWRNFERLDFTPNWRNVNSINLKWKSCITSSLEMAFAWILAMFTLNVIDWAIPTSIWNVSCFLGFANSYWHFIIHYSSIMALLIRLTKKHQFFSWGIEVNNCHCFYFSLSSHIPLGTTRETWSIVVLFIPCA